MIFNLSFPFPNAMVSWDVYINFYMLFSGRISKSEAEVVSWIIPKVLVTRNSVYTKLLIPLRVVATLEANRVRLFLYSFMTR